MSEDLRWIPRLTRVDDPIADDYWKCIDLKRKSRIVRVTVGRPACILERQIWYCPVRITGSTRGIEPIFGMGPADALMNAMTLVKIFWDQHLEISPGAKPQRTARKRMGQARQAPRTGAKRRTRRAQ